MPPLLRRHGRFDEAVPPIDQFLLASMCELDRAYERADSPLITRCLQSPDLDEENFPPRATVLTAGDEFDFSRAAGDHLAVQEVRKTTDIRRISDAVPQDLAILSRGPSGRRQFLEKFVNEGILILEHQDLTDRNWRRRLLVCLVAGAGDTVNTRRTSFHCNPRVRGRRSGQGDLDGDSPDSHARGLVCDILRDLGRFLRDPELIVDIRLFLVHLDSRFHRTRHLDLDEIREWLIGDRYDFLLELETRIPGYFFGHGSDPTSTAEGPREFLERTLSLSDYDDSVLVFLGREDAVSPLLPRFFATRERGDKLRTTVYLGQLERWQTQVKLVSSEITRHASGFGRFEVVSDEELRSTIIRACLRAGC